ncbi:MAG: hypothetical protein IJ367_04830 [Clostridia bacterium]|nr:hypothetical protein [Clostridia bacterium]
MENLTAGKHKVTVEINLPTATDMEQPFLFSMDYIDFVPRKAILKPGKKA